MPVHLDASLQWLDGHLDLLLPDLRDAQYDRELLQRCGELALLYRAMCRSPSTFQPMQQSWRERIETFVTSEELIEISRKSLHCAWAWLMPYFIFKEIHGLTVNEHEQTMRFALEAGLPFAAEVLAYRRLDQHYFCSLNGHVEIELGQLVDQTYLSQCQDLLWIDRESAYSISHTLFYVTDFGSLLLRREHPAHAKVSDVLVSLLPQFARNGDWDVVGELLLCAFCVQDMDSSVLDDYLQEFRGQQQPAGYTPPSSPTLKALENVADRHSIFSACHHTTLVAALLELTAIMSKQQRHPAATFRLREWPTVDYNVTKERVLAARNRAVEYLNRQSDQGAILYDSRMPSVLTQSSDLQQQHQPLRRQDRDCLLNQLALGGTRQIDRCEALSIAECFARDGDLEVVLRLIEAKWIGQENVPRHEALLRYVLQSQREDGSVGCFLHEGRRLGVNDLSIVRNSLTHLFVETADAWLDSWCTA